MHMQVNYHTENSLFEATIVTVSALNLSVARMLERNFPLSWVTGEISNFTRAASGHWYFTLKDESAQIRAVMFRGRAQFANFQPRDGDKVEVRALVTLYTARGDYQLSVETIRRAGVGNLYDAFLRLKTKLGVEGLFEQSRKKPLPLFAKTIGVITSLNAAALQDVLTALRRRTPHINIIVYPTSVQGEGAAQKIAQVIHNASTRAECDVLLLCRGGGSIEDLWSFNEELVARAIVACSIPIISGIGHETDFTIADFTADFRGATPTAAAELAAKSRNEWVEKLCLVTTELNRNMKRKLTNFTLSLDWFSRRLSSPSYIITRERMKLTHIQRNFVHAAGLMQSQLRHEIKHLRIRLSGQFPSTQIYHLTLAQKAKQLHSSLVTQNSMRAQKLLGLSSQLEMLNPQRTLERGYALVTDASGIIIRDTKQLLPRSTITIQLASGSAQVGVSNVQD